MSVAKVWDGTQWVFLANVIAPSTSAVWFKDWTPNQAVFPSSNFPQLTMVNTSERRPVLAFDDTTAESCFVDAVVPTSPGTTFAIKLFYIMASATSGAVMFSVAVEAVTPGDALNLTNATSYDSDNTGTSNVSGTAGYEQCLSIALASYDGLAAGDRVRIRIKREAANASDTAAGDCYLTAIALQGA